MIDMKKNILFFIFILCVFISFILYEEITPSYEQKVYENITNVFLSSEIVKENWEKYDCKVPINVSIINVLYIRKEGLHLAFNCFNGPFYGDILESNRINCQKEKIEEEINTIYDAVHEKNNCAFPLENPFKGEGFYGIIMACDILESEKKMEENNQSFYIKKESICPRKGNYSIFYFVADPKTNKIYY